MNKYELAVVFKPLDEETFKAEFEKVKELITKFGGTIEKIDAWGKRKLAYEINKISDGIYQIVTITAGSDLPAELEARLRINESVLRYLITRQEV